MQQLAAALAIAVAYIEERTTDGDLDADVAALEAIAFEIQNGSPDEQRAIAIVLSAHGRSDLIEELGIQPMK